MQQSIIITRILLGLYMSIYFIILIPFTQELYSNAATQTQSISIIPNIFDVFTIDIQIQITLAVAALISLVFALGYLHQPLAALIFYIWMCMFTKNPLTEFPSMHFIGWILLVFVLINNKQEKTNKLIIKGAWIILGVGYTLSGITKLAAPLWISGDTLQLLFTSPLAQGIAPIIALFPAIILKLITWATLLLQIAAAPLFIIKKTRKTTWVALTITHIITLITLDLVQVSLGMLIFHLFVIPDEWVPKKITKHIKKFFSNRYSKKIFTHLS